ncbi:hypothetical protein MMC27_003425 [Xylographa pallens]|nr:hypothetical protein [Xylographa pallens]
MSTLSAVKSTPSAAATSTSSTAVSTSLASLTQELISQIASYLEPGRGMRISLTHTRSSLPTYATISKRFQYAVEYRTFNSIELDSDEIGYFAAIFVGYRRKFLATLKYWPVLDTYPVRVFRAYEHPDQMRHNNYLFTDAVVGLFEVLRSWEEEDKDTAGEEKVTSSRPFELYLLEPRSPTDSLCFEQRRVHPGTSLGKHRLEHSFLKYLDYRRLPNLSRILHFSAHVYRFRRVEPRSLVMITASMIGLKTIDWRLSDEEKFVPLTAQNNRFEFALALPNLSTDPLTSFRLNYERQVPINHDYEPPSVLLPTLPTIDHLSLALHTLSQSQNLTELTLSGPLVISDALFWPATSATASLSRAPGLPFWPNMQKLVVEFSPIAPDGSWCFLREELSSVESAHEAREMERATQREAATYAPEWGDCYNALTMRTQIGLFPAREFRRVPDAAKIPALMLALARAAARMPRLKRLHVDVAPRLPFAFGVRYLAPGEAYRPFFDVGNPRIVYRKTTAPLDDEALPRLYWTVRGWRPVEEVLALWRGREQEGELQVRFYSERAATEAESANGGPVVVGSWSDE